MAIQKTKSLPNGTQGNYWRILSITFNRETLVCTGKIGLFKDKATSDAGGTHLGIVKNFSFPFSTSDLIGSTNLIALVYTRILEKANTMVTKDLEGKDLNTPVPMDQDLAGGISVL